VGQNPPAPGAAPCVPVRGYPDLVVHGPLLALLALELPRLHSPGTRVAELAYRLVRPAYSPGTLVAAGTPDGDTAVISVAAQHAAASLNATVRLEPGGPAR